MDPSLFHGAAQPTFQRGTKMKVAAFRLSARLTVVCVCFGGGMQLARVQGVPGVTEKEILI